MDDPIISQYRGKSADTTYSITQKHLFLTACLLYTPALSDYSVTHLLISKEAGMMRVIAVLNQKGGAGKTTIATHLARALQLDGADVLLVDSDPQGSARDWAAVREDQPVPVVGLDRPTIERDLKSIAQKDYVIIDGAPQAHDLAVSALKAAHFILIPVQPSPYDIWATSDLVDLVKQRMELTEGQLKAAFLISRAIRNTKLG
jgi:chromosome partitioning protein